MSHERFHRVTSAFMRIWLAAYIVAAAYAYVYVF